MTPGAGCCHAVFILGTEDWRLQADLLGCPQSTASASGPYTGLQYPRGKVLFADFLPRWMDKGCLQRQWGLESAIPKDSALQKLG